MSIVTMDMSSYEINHSVDEESLRSDWNPALALQLRSEKPDTMPQNMVKMNTDVFMERMHAIEVNAKVFLKNMYACQ